MQAPARGPSGTEYARHDIRSPPQPYRRALTQATTQAGAIHFISDKKRQPELKLPFLAQSETCANCPPGYGAVSTVGMIPAPGTTIVGDIPSWTKISLSVGCSAEALMVSACR